NPRWRTILLLAVAVYSPDALAAPRPGDRIPVDGTADLGRLLVPEGETLTVRVTDPDGHPLADATVWITLEIRREQPALVTGADGEVRLSGIPPSTRFGVEVCRPGSMPFDSWLSSVPAKRLDAVLGPAAAITGIVVDADGAPVPGAWLFAQRNGTPE